MTEEDRQHLEDLLRANQRRLRPLEKRRAEFGSSTPPEVLSEIEDIRAEIVRIESALGRVIMTTYSAETTELRRQALKSYFRKEWSQAISLLAQVVLADPTDEDARTKLADARRQLRLQEEYHVICELRDEGRWQVVLEALNDLNRRQPGYPDSEHLREWVGERQKREDVGNKPQETVDKSSDEDMQILRDVKMISNVIRNKYPREYKQNLSMLAGSDYKLNPRITGQWGGKWLSKSENQQSGTVKLTMYQIDDIIIGIGSLSNSIYEDVYLKGKLDGRKIVIEFFNSDTLIPCIVTAFLKGDTRNPSIYGNYEVLNYDDGEFDIRKIEKDK